MNNLHTHAKAVEAAVGAARGLTPADEPLVALARALARQVDAAGVEGPGSRLVASYLTTVRMLMARLDASIPDDDNALSRMRSLHRPPPPKKRRAVS